MKRVPLPASHEAAFIVPRLFGETKHPGHGQLANLHWFPASRVAFGWYIEGWLDITHPQVPFSKLAYDALGTESDYKAMKARVARVEHLVALDRGAAQAMLP